MTRKRFAKRRLRMRYTAVILVGLTLLFSGCITSRPPAPVLGEDIAQVKKGGVVPFSGTIFSPFYLNEYLQWKEYK